MTPTNVDRLRPLKVCLLSYRSNPHSGGQGVYIRHLSRALTSMGHRVHVVAGPPGPDLDDPIKLSKIPCLDLYNPDTLFRMPTLKELGNPVNLIEWMGVSLGGFPEPLTFGLRAYHYLTQNLGCYDIIHDNQSLSYGIWALSRKIPTIATIHHPITIDRLLAVRTVSSVWKKFQRWRWHSFIGMQKRVARSLPFLITVSEQARKDIGRDFRVSQNRFRVIPNGIDTDRFHPIPDVQREKGRIMVTNSSDTPLKGLYYLLIALKRLVERKKTARLVVIGAPKKKGGIEKLIGRLGIGNRVTFTGRIDQQAFVRQYAKASVAVVPSLYEGFGLPAGEAMACRVPVISTTGGALSEVVGNAGILVPPGDPAALSAAIERLLDNPEESKRLADRGYKRVHDCFTWNRAAEKTVAAYREAIDAHRRF